MSCLSLRFIDCLTRRKKSLKLTNSLSFRGTYCTFDKSPLNPSSNLHNSITAQAEMRVLLNALLFQKRWPEDFYKNNLYFFTCCHSHRICGKSKEKSIFCSSRQWCIYVKRQRTTEEKTGVIPIGKREISWWNLIIWVSEWRTWKEIPLLVLIDVSSEEDFHTG